MRDTDETYSVPCLLLIIINKRIANGRVRSLEKRNYNNSKPKGNFRPNNNQNRQKQRTERPQRRRRVAVDRNTEVVVVSNTIGRFYYSNPRMSTILDLNHIGDEEYITVGDLRTILNSSRKILEGFQLLITEVVDSEYTLEDVLLFLGLDRKYDEYFSLTKKFNNEGIATAGDIKSFILNTSVNAFEKVMQNIDPKLRARIIEASVALFKLKEFGDYNKMQIIESYVNDELFDDAKVTEIDNEIYI